MVEISQSNLKEAAELLYGIKNGMGKATARAINHTTAKAKTQMKRKVGKDYYIKQGDVDKTLKVKKASWTNPFATITSKSRVLGLDKFKVTVKGGVVRAAISKLEGYKDRKGGFIANVKNFSGGSWRREKGRNIFTPNFSHKSGARVFKRIGKKRLPVKSLYGASVPGMIGSKNVIADLNKFVIVETNKRLSHEVGRLLGGFR
ncbi:MAG: phage tail protein [Cetobacterium sp.]